VVYDGPNAHRTALEVRGYHDQIKGVDSRGRRYHALNPDTYYWAHSTFFMSTILIADNFMGGITEAQKRQLFDEHVQWYRMYDMSMRPVPESWEGFQAYWKRVCTEVLEDNKATRIVGPQGTREAAVPAVAAGRRVEPASGAHRARFRLADRRHV
jgi:uncharacterized protein (DUF2236 family)